MMPPGAVLDLCRTSWAVRQITPGRCEWLGEGDGLGDLERERLGDGLGELDFDGLGLLLGDGLGLVVTDGVVELVGVCDGVVLIGLMDGLAFDDVVALSKLADTTAAVPLPQSELMGRAGEARAGARANPDARKEPAARQTTIRPACTIPLGTTPLRSSGRPQPEQPSDVPVLSTNIVGNSRRLANGARIRA
jgi:hypothetical protein